MEDDVWTLVASVLPSGIELNPKNDEECTVSNGENEIKVIHSSENTYIVNGIKLHFEDEDFEMVNTLLIPYILQELDGQRRF